MQNAGVVQLAGAGNGGRGWMGPYRYIYLGRRSVVTIISVYKYSSNLKMFVQESEKTY